MEGAVIQINDIYLAILGKKDYPLIVMLMDYDQKKWLYKYAMGDFRQRLIDLMCDSPILVRSMQEYEIVLSQNAKEYGPGMFRRAK